MAQDTMEVLCRRIVEGVPDAVVFADRGGVIRLWNAGAAEMFGHAADEAVGQSLDIIIPDNLRGRHWEGYRKTMETGITKYGKELLAVPGIRKDGSRISLEFSVAMIRDDSGRLQGIVAVLRDVTARWMKEKELKERLASMEAQRG